MNKNLTPIQALRLLTGMFNPDHAVNILAMVNLLARYLDNDPILSESFLKKQFQKIGIDLILDSKIIPCPHCGTTELLCGHNGVGCTGEKSEEK